jgi:hypothetical protein
VRERERERGSAREGGMGRAGGRAREIERLIPSARKGFMIMRRRSLFVCLE